MGTAIATAAIANAFEEVAKAFCDAGRKCASFGNAAFRLSCAAEDFHTILKSVSKLLDETLASPIISFTVITLKRDILLLKESRSNSYKITSHCVETVKRKRLEL